MAPRAGGAPIGNEHRQPPGLPVDWADGIGERGGTTDASLVAPTPTSARNALQSSLHWSSALGEAH